jgi:AcrR family transcriptional regulator
MLTAAQLPIRHGKGASITDKAGAPRTPTRRRGAALEQAIYAAVLAELAEVGYAGFSLDRVARRARIGRMSIYRRWPGKPGLVADAIRHTLPPIDDPPDTGRVRDDLLACFEQMSRLQGGLIWVALQAMLDSPPGTPGNALAALVRDQVVEPRLQLILDVLLKAAARGEIRAEAAVPVLARTGPALILQHALLYGTPPARPYLEDIIDRIILPAAAHR